MALMSRVGAVFYNLGLIVTLILVFLCIKNYNLDDPEATLEYSQALTALRQRLGSAEDLSTGIEVESNGGGENQPLSRAEILCPTCGDVMQRRERLRRRTRCPPY